MLSAKGMLLGEKHTNRKSVTRNYRDGIFSLLNSKTARRRGAYLFLFIFYGGVNDEHIRRSVFLLLLKSPNNCLGLAKSDFARNGNCF